MLNLGDEVEVRVSDIDNQGKLSLSLVGEGDDAKWRHRAPMADRASGSQATASRMGRLAADEGATGIERPTGKAAGGQAERRNLCPSSSTGRTRPKTNSATSARLTSGGRNAAAAAAEVAAAAVAAAGGEVAEAAAGRPGGGPGRHRTGAGRGF